MDVMSRLAFLKSAGLMAVSAALLPSLEGCGSSSPTNPGGGLDVTYTVADFPALATTGNAALDTTRAIILLRTSATQIQAFSAICTHQSCTVGVNNARHRYECPCHGSVYASDGSVISGPAPSRLTALTATFDTVAGTVHVTG